MSTPATRPHVVAVAGDWHGDGAWGRAVIAAAAAARVREIWHVGDVGVGPWNGSRHEPPHLDPGGVGEQIEPALAAAGIRLLLTPGNHENYDTISRLPRDSEGRGLLTEHVRVAPRGHRWTAHGRTIGSLGGTGSIDVRERVRGVDWWPEERVTEEDVEALGDRPLDVLLVHDAPSGVDLPSTANVTAAARRYAEMSRALIAQAVRNTRPRLLVAGHWHTRASKTLGATRVEVLDRERTTGNAAILDLDTLTLRPLPIARSA